MSLALRVWRISLVSVIVFLECCVLGFSVIGVFIFAGRIRSLADGAAVVAPFLSVPLLLVVIRYPRKGTTAYWIALTLAHCFIALTGPPSLQVFVAPLRILWPLYAIGVLLGLLLLSGRRESDDYARS